MMNARLNIRAERRLYKNCIDLLVVAYSGDSEKIAVAQPLTMVQQDRFSAIEEPTMELTFEQAQELMDELWRVGLRPTEGTGSAGSLAATERHLKDMQRIALGLLKSKGVE
jgi:hypothetical protein